ncbi:MAG: thioredoxin family protein [Phycisphaerales bacterium]
MRRAISLLTITLVFSMTTTVLARDAVQLEPKAEATQKQDAKPKPIYDEQADAREQIAEALKHAKKENRRVLIQWGANWCGWCHLLHDTFKKDRDVRRELLYEYDLVLIDVGRFDKNVELAAEYEADFKKHGLPYLTVLDADGNAIANQETGSLEAKGDGAKGHDPKAVLDFLTEHQAPNLDAESILASGLRAAKDQNKRVFLHFGAPWCGWCHRLEDWMADENVAAILSKHFVDVKIDIDRTLRGNEMKDRMTKGESAGIPWYAFLDAEGKIVADSTLPEKGNIGYPYTNVEIATFMKVIQKAARTLSDDDIKRLVKSLRNSGEEANKAK